ncbi:MAG: pilus assembly protein PilP [Tatlockia sp.]|nr:pilus assembly protein PilP [Tatlockia sp.]
MKKNCIFLSFLSVLLMACDSASETRLAEYINRVKNQPMQQPEPDPQLVKLAKFTYSGEAALRTLFQMKSDKKLAKNRTKNKETLEELPLESLKFVGILKKESEIWALVSQIGGKLFSIKVGDVLGEKKERVIAIKENVLLLEKRTIVAGKSEKELKEIYLNSDDSPAANIL